MVQGGTSKWATESWGPRAHWACGEQRLAHLVRFHRSATIAQVVENTGCDTNITTQCMDVDLQKKHLQWACEHHNRTMKQWGKVGLVPFFYFF